MAIRMGGAFPFQAGIPGGWGNTTGQIILQLAPGASVFPPAGKYELTSSLVTIIQNWDPQEQTWRAYGGLGPSSDNQDWETDGFNWRLFNSSGVVVAGYITAAGTSATNGIGTTVTGATVSLGAAPSNGIAAVMVPIVGGQIGSTATITTAGAGLLAPPLLVVDPPPVGGVQATMYVSGISAGGIQGVTVSNQGAGYTVVPNVKVIPQFAWYAGGPTADQAAAAIGNYAGVAGPGVAAQNIENVGVFTTVPVITAGAITGSGTLTGLNMYSNGFNYTGSSIPTITLGGTLVGSPGATAIMSFSVTAFSGGTLPGSSTTYTWTTDLGLVATKVNNHYYLARPAKANATSGPTWTLQDPGFGLQKVPVGGGWSGAQYTTATGAIPTITCGGITDVVYLAMV